MSGTLIAFIILTAIIGGYLIDYQKNKLKWQSNNAESNQDINELQKQLEKVTKRIENLEAIIADESYGKKDEYDIRFDSEPDETLRFQNQKSVAQKAKEKGE